MQRLAVGLPPDVAKQGIAMGYALNYATREAAQAEALKRCREFRDAPQTRRATCAGSSRISATVAWRSRSIPRSVRPGSAGPWRRSRQLAEEIAMEKCVDTAGKKRRDFCRITFTRCDKK